jgi:ADP-ribose pyrophosphatase
VSAPTPPIPDDPPPFAPFGVERREHVYVSHWCALRRDMVHLPNGKLQEYHVFEIPDAIVVLPVLKDGSIVLIGQYRYPHGKTHWEIPAGRLVDGEDPREGALREVREETGHVPRSLEPLPGFYAANGITAHWAHLYLAHGCQSIGAPQPEPCERIVVRVFTREEVEALLDAGRIEDAFTALALCYWLRRQR